MSISCSMGPSWAARPHWLTGTSKRSTTAPLPGSPVLCLCTLVAWLCPFRLGSSPRVPLKFSCNSGLVFVWVCVCSYAQSCLTLFNPRDCSPLGSSVHGISQARILGNSFASSGNLPDPGIEPTHDSFVGRAILYQWATWEAGPGLYSVILIRWRKFYDVESQVVRIEMSSPLLASSVSHRRTSENSLHVWRIPSSSATHILFSVLCIWSRWLAISIHTKKQITTDCLTH